MIRSFRFVAIVLTLMVAGLSGCEGVGRTAADVDRDTKRAFKYDSYMMTDDLALFFQTDRPLRTNKNVID